VSAHLRIHQEGRKNPTPTNEISPVRADLCVCPSPHPSRGQEKPCPYEPTIPFITNETSPVNLQGTSETVQKYIEKRRKI